MKVGLNISPCPNDTFMFYALLHGAVDTEGLSFEVSFADIEQLNRRLLGGQVDVSKMSYALLPAVVADYRLLDSGSALGRGNGPLLVCAEGRETDLSESSLRVAVPGLHTTANLLMERLYPNLNRKSELLFSSIAAAVTSGEFDCGVLIHEGRFTYRSEGLRLIADLGIEWERRFDLPLPLGAIVVNRRLPDTVFDAVERTIARSVDYALSNPEQPIDFVLSHAQKMQLSVVKSHIDLFVNQYSRSLGKEGRRAVEALVGNCFER